MLFAFLIELILFSFTFFVSLFVTGLRSQLFSLFLEFFSLSELRYWFFFNFGRYYIIGRLYLCEYFSLFDFFILPGDVGLVRLDTHRLLASIFFPLWEMLLRLFLLSLDLLHSFLLNLFRAEFFGELSFSVAHEVVFPVDVYLLMIGNDLTLGFFELTLKDPIGKLILL